MAESLRMRGDLLNAAVQTRLLAAFLASGNRPAWAVILLGLISLATLPAQSRQPGQMGVSQLRERALAHVERGTFAEGIPVFEEIVRRFQHASGEDRQLLESAYLFIGLGYMQRYSASNQTSLLEQSLQAFNRYATEFPMGERRHLMHLFRADCLRGLGQWEEAADDLEKALSPPLLSNLSRSQRIDALEKLTQALYIREAWERGMPWFRQLLALAANPDQRTMAAAALTEATLQSGQYDQLPQLLPYLTGDSPARYDVRFNLQLLRGGDRLTEVERYLEAALLYYMTLTKQELLDYWESRLVRLQNEVARVQANPLHSDPDRIAELEISQANARNQIEALSEVPTYTAELEWRKARNFKDVGRDWEAFWAFWRLAEDFQDRAEYIEDYYYAAFIQAELLEETARAEKIANLYLDRAEWTRYRREISVTYAGLLLRTAQHERLIAFCTRYIARDPEDLFNAQLVYYLGATFLELERYEDLVRQLSAYLRDHPWTAMEDGCLYWTGLAMLFTEDYDTAVTRFQRLVDQFTESPYREDARFRIGVARFADDRHAEAEKIFTAFIRDFPESTLRGEAELFLGDIAAADARVGKALRHYDNVPVHTTEMGFINHALFQKVKLLEANNRYEEMERVLREYQETYGAEGQLTAAIFEQGRAFELMGQPEKMLHTYLEAIARYGNDPDTEGLDRIISAYPLRHAEYQRRLRATLDFLNAFIQRQPFRENLMGDRRQLFQYFTDHPDIEESLRNRLLRDNEFRALVNRDLSILVTERDTLQKRLDALPRETPADAFLSLHGEAHERGERTLVLRLAMALEQLGQNVNPGEIFSERDIKLASAATLVWMAQRLDSYQNLALRPLIRQALQGVLEDYPRAEEANLEALMTLGNIAARSADIEGAIQHYSRAQKRFPTSPRAVEAVLRQGDVLMEAGRYAEAIEHYETVLKTRAWRGPAWAEAQYKIGVCHFRQERYSEAHAYFERTFLAFSQFRDWAARAYLRDAETLLRLGAREDARRTLEEFLNQPDADQAPAFADIQRLHRSIL